MGESDIYSTVSFVCNGAQPKADKLKAVNSIPVPYALLSSFHPDERTSRQPVLETGMAGAGAEEAL